MSIIFDKISFAYKNNAIFSDFSLTIPAGGRTVLTGANGSGKSTLGRLAVGLLRPHKGRVLLGGEDISGLALFRIGRLAGYLCQQPERQVFARTVLEDVAFPLTLCGESGQTAVERAKAALSRFSLLHLSEHSPFTLSRGETGRLKLASIFVRNTPIIILDEPTTALDSESKRVLSELLCEYKGTVLLISHDRAFCETLGKAEVVPL